jgi:hypothetical protein
VLEAKLIRENPRADRLEGLKPADQDRIMGTLLLETVVIDVEGLTEDDGKTPVTYSRELGKQLLLDPDYRVLRAGAGLCRPHRRRPSCSLPGDRGKKLAGVLIWQLDWGDKIDGIVAAVSTAGILLATLPCLANRLELPSHLSLEALAFVSFRRIARRPSIAAPFRGGRSMPCRPLRPGR